MRVQDVPQDECLFEGWREICYAVDDSGRYVSVPSAGWDPANIANIQAWEDIRAGLREAAGQARDGTMSPLLYHMRKHLMDSKLLAGYAGMAHWRVKRHLQPRVFHRLKPGVLERYARVFGLSVEELRTIPAITDKDSGKDQ